MNLKDFVPGILFKGKISSIRHCHTTLNDGFKTVAKPYMKSSDRNYLGTVPVPGV